MNFSFATLQASQAATALVGRVNLQMQQTAATDETGADQAAGKPGEVLLNQPDSFVSLSYDAATASPTAFSFKALQNLVGPDGAVVVPSGTESSYTVFSGKETYRMQVPSEQGVVGQQVVIDNASGKVSYSEGSQSAPEFSVETSLAAQASAALIGKLQLQIAEAAAVDEQAGLDQAAGQPGQVLLDDQATSVRLSVDPETSAPMSFAFQAKQNLAGPDGAILVAAGSQSSYQRQGQVESFSQDVPTPQGTVRQQVVLDSAAQSVDFQEFILNA